MSDDAAYLDLDTFYQVTPEDEAHVLQHAFSSRQPLRLKSIPARQKRKYLALKVIAAEFAFDRTYTEPEVNAVLGGIHEDYSALRRYLIDYRLLQRTRDGSSYWRA